MNTEWRRRDAGNYGSAASLNRVIPKKPPASIQIFEVLFLGSLFHSSVPHSHVSIHGTTNLSSLDVRAALIVILELKKKHRKKIRETTPFERLEIKATFRMSHFIGDSFSCGSQTSSFFKQRLSSFQHLIKCRSEEKGRRASISSVY